MAHSFSVRLSQLLAGRSSKTYRLLFEEHEERNIVIVVRHVGSPRLAFRRGYGIDGSLSAVECAGPVPEEFAGAAVHRSDGPIAVAFNSGQFGGHRPVDFAVVLLEMLGIVGCLVENDEVDHWYLLLVSRSDNAFAFKPDWVVRFLGHEFQKLFVARSRRQKVDIYFRKRRQIIILMKLFYDFPGEPGLSHEARLELLHGGRMYVR